MIWSHNDLWMLTADHSGFVKYWQSNMNNVKMYQAHRDPVRGLRWDALCTVAAASVVFQYYDFSASTLDIQACYLVLRRQLVTVHCLTVCYLISAVIAVVFVRMSVMMPFVIPVASH